MTAFFSDQESMILIFAVDQINTPTYEYSSSSNVYVASILSDKSNMIKYYRVIINLLPVRIHHVWLVKPL